MSFCSFIYIGQSYKYYLSHLLSFKMSQLIIMLKLSKKWKKIGKKKHGEIFTNFMRYHEDFFKICNAPLYTINFLKWNTSNME
jgi:hypothetical protein